MFVSVDLGNSRIMMMAAERQSDGMLSQGSSGRLYDIYHSDYGGDVSYESGY